MFGSKKRAVRARIAQAGFSSGIARFVADIVGRTRLRRAEQIDVAGELVSHFAEGLAAGRSESALIGAYGDPKASARDLRRSAIAKRGALDRAIGSVVWWGLVATGCFIGGYTAYATMLYFRSPVISFDAKAAANARMPNAGAEGRAIDVYMQALADDAGVMSRDSAAQEVFDRHLFAIGFDAAALAAVKSAHEPLRARIDALRTLKDRPVLGLPLEVGTWSDAKIAAFFGLPTSPTPVEGPFADAMLSAVLPQLAMVRDTARLLCVDAALAAHEGRADDFVADIEAALVMAGHASENGVLIGGLVEAGVEALVLGTVVSAIENHGEGLSDAQLQRLEALVAKPRDGIARGAEGEKLFLRDMIQRCYSDDGHGDGVLLSGTWVDMVQELTPKPIERTDGSTEGTALLTAEAFVGGPIAATLAPTRRELLARVDHHIDGMVGAMRAATRAEGVERAIQLGQELEHGADRGRAMDLVSLLMPAMSHAAVRSWATRAAVDGAIAAIGIERYRRANGRFPNDLLELSAFVGRTLGGSCDMRVSWKYALVDGRPLIYDAGIDGLDDRARPALGRWPEPSMDDEILAPSPVRLVALGECAADGATRIGPNSAGVDGVTLRSRTSVAPDAALDPTQPIADIETAGVLRTDGDLVRVWWKSGATGASRAVPARAVQ